MIDRMLITSVLIVATSLAACSQSGSENPTTPDVAKETSRAAPERTEVLNADAVQPISGSALAEVRQGTAACAFDSVDGDYSATQARLNKSSAHVFRGWALAEDRRVAKDIKLVLKGTDSFAISAHTGVNRPDVGAFFNNPNLNPAGFNFSTTLKSVPQGKYYVLLVTQLGGFSYGCETKKSMTIF